MRRTIILAGLVLGLVAFGTAFASSAKADTVGPINFDPPQYHVGDINGQMGWTKTGPYDVKIAANDHYPAVETYRFGEFALRLVARFLTFGRKGKIGPPYRLLALNEVQMPLAF